MDDSVWHKSLFVKLYRLGINGILWRILVHSYRNIHGCVFINASKSKVLQIRQGTRQDKEIFNFYFTIYLYDLDLLRASGFRIHLLDCRNTTDDIVCLAIYPRALQILLNTLYHLECRWRLVFSAEKNLVFWFSWTNPLTAACVSTRWNWAMRL